MIFIINGVSIANGGPEVKIIQGEVEFVLFQKFIHLLLGVNFDATRSEKTDIPFACPFTALPAVDSFGPTRRQVFLHYLKKTKVYKEHRC